MYKKLITDLVNGSSNEKNAGACLPVLPEDFKVGGSFPCLFNCLRFEQYLLRFFQGFPILIHPVLQVLRSALP